MAHKKQSAQRGKKSNRQRPDGQARNPPPGKAASSSAAIISPAVDFLCCGGISILAVLAIFLFAWSSPGSKFLTEGFSMASNRIPWENIIVMGILGTLINAPHFMASYHLLYRRREYVWQHKLASLWVPVIFIATIGFALLTPDRASHSPFNKAVVDSLMFLNVLLLAWHYTGQAWGMTGAFAYIAGIRMDGLERRLIRSGYYALLVWHVLWAWLFALRQPGSFIADKFSAHIPQFQTAYNIWSAIVLLTIPLGIIGFLRIRRRTGMMPPLRSFSPWIAIYLWYVMIWAYPVMFPFLQIFHALQYLIFPLRVETNLYSARKQRSGVRRVLHAIGYYLILVIVGLIVFETPMPPYLVGLIAAFVNIHHYFIDGAIWKIRNAEVRRDLFAHLKMPANAGPVVMPAK